MNPLPQPSCYAPRIASGPATRIFTLVVSAVVFTACCFASPVPKHAEPKARQDAAPVVAPAALQALKTMGAYLRTLQSFQVDAELSTDDVSVGGQIIQSNSKVNLLASKPNQFRVDVSGDDVNRLYLYDGKSFTVYGKETNFYATVPAPPTIPEVIDKLEDRFAIDLPLVDLFRWGLNDADVEMIKTAVDVGPTSVEGVTCEQYVFHQDNIDWQIWIQLGKYPLPRKLIIRTLTDDAKPQHSEVFTWNLAPSFDDAAFVFDPPPDAHRIVLEEMKGKATEKSK